MEKDTIEINFKPLSAGLGFHPFSDGLPYAPVSPTPTKPQTNTAPRPAPVTTTPASATIRSANTPALPTQKPNLPHLQSRPLAQTSARITDGIPQAEATPSRVAQVHVPVARAASQSLNVKSAKTQAAAAVSNTVGTSETKKANGLMYSVRRVLAYLFDSIVNIGAAAIAFSLALWNQNLQPELLLNSGVILLAGLFFFVFSWAILTAQEIAFGTTLGKRVFKLGLQGSTAAIFLRAFFFLPSFAFLGVGLLWGLIDRKKRCWHDLVVNLQPIDLPPS